MTLAQQFAGVVKAQIGLFGNGGTRSPRFQYDNNGTHTCEAQMGGRSIDALTACMHVLPSCILRHARGFLLISGSWGQLGCLGRRARVAGCHRARGGEGGQGERARPQASPTRPRAQPNRSPPNALPAVTVWWDSVSSSVQFGLGGAASSRTFAYVTSTTNIVGGGNSDPHLQVRAVRLLWRGRLAPRRRARAAARPGLRASVGAAQDSRRSAD